MNICCSWSRFLWPPSGLLAHRPWALKERNAYPVFHADLLPSETEKATVSTRFAIIYNQKETLLTSSFCCSTLAGKGGNFDRGRFVFRKIGSNVWHPCLLFLKDETKGRETEPSSAGHFCWICWLPVAIMIRIRVARILLAYDFLWALFV